MEYSVSLSSDDADIDNEFKKYGFNIKSDIKNLKISPDDIDFIKEETLNIVVNEIMQKQHKYLIVSNSDCTVKVVKVRVADKTNKHGERGGKGNNISGIAKKLIYLLKLDKNLIRCLYFFDTSEKQSIDENKEVKYRVMKSKLDNKLMLTTDSCFIENSMTEWRANG